MSSDEIVDDIFNSYLSRPKVFANRDALRIDYVPERLPHREEQIKIVAGVLAPFLQGQRGSNLFVYGQTGTGKTAVVRYVLERLKDRSQKGVPKTQTCYVNCRITGTGYRVLACLGQTLGVEVPFTGLATSEVLNRFRQALSSKKLLLIVTLDEIDALVKDYGDNLLYQLTRLNENLDYGRVSIIGISNDLRFKERLDPRVLSSLNEEEVVFKPYTALEIRDILLERASVAFQKGTLEDSALALCSAEAAREHGDARRALDLLRVAGEVAEREGCRYVKDVQVIMAQKRIENDRVSTVLCSMPLHSKLILCSAYLLSAVEDGRTITGNVYEVYKELCGQSKTECLTQRRVSGLVNELDVLGLLNTQLMSLGRYGRTKRISLGIPAESIKEIYADDPWISPLLNFRPISIRKGTH
ncbi:orc1/cdc6 family replication initiation protein [Candidatus Bathyarchaeota archaeon]|nr:orc1/cdc6 family replication initiation protein [Candidatus Bathyarchaeota archaeon]